ncbi:hypothetical protein GGR53DRAFT_516596 [Hypoxylon sp. FL1150]|nr:hypothetical protein GGR53DRAFT_516596 [Hypoxylon sp. FL1150]
MATSRAASYNMPEHNEPQYALSRTIALTDALSGTTPLSRQHTTVSLLKTDIRLLAAAIPRILVTVIRRAPQTTSWVEWRETVLYFIVSLVELQLLISLCLWLVVPGIALLPWLGLQVASVWGILLCVNSRSQPFVSRADRLTRNDATDDKLESCDWFVVGGLVNNERMRHTVLPRLARIFGDDMHAFPPYRLGFPLDIVLMLLQRNLHMATARSVSLYSSVRTSILNPKINHVRIIAHNTGALDISWLLSHLCADIPAGSQLNKLQVFTFGAASTEMTLPLGKDHSQSDGSSKLLYPDVTHYAFTDDPIAKIGVLLGVRQRLDGRFVGDLWYIFTRDLLMFQ